jgi:hypothetical protein
MADRLEDISEIIHRSMGNLSEARASVASARWSIAMSKAIIEQSRNRLADTSQKQRPQRLGTLSDDQEGHRRRENGG